MKMFKPVFVVFGESGLYAEDTHAWTVIWFPTQAGAKDHVSYATKWAKQEYARLLGQTSPKVWRESGDHFVLVW